MGQTASCLNDTQQVKNRDPIPAFLDYASFQHITDNIGGDYCEDIFDTFKDGTGHITLGNFTKIVKMMPKYEENFNMLASNNDGLSDFITMEQFNKLLVMMGEDTDPDESDYIERDIYFNEFLWMMAIKVVDSMMANEDDYEKAFNILDSNGDGFIDEEDLIRVLENYGENADKEKVERMIQEADFNFDGKIDLGEFKVISGQCTDAKSPTRNLGRKLIRGITKRNVLYDL